MRIVVQMRHANPDWDDWYIDFPDGGDQAITTVEGFQESARSRAEIMSEDNGGGWEFVAFLDCLPHENAPA